MVDNKITSYYVLPHEDNSWPMKKALLTHISMKEYTNYDEFAELFDKFYFGFQDLFKKTFKDYFDKLSEIEKQDTLNNLLPYIANNALKIVDLFMEKKIEILCQMIPHTIKLTKEQCLSIISNMFFCTIIPPKNEKKKLHPTYNFKSILLWSGSCQIENLRCIMNYFSTMKKYEETNKSVLSQIIVFNRLAYNPHDEAYDINYWLKLEENLCEIDILSEGSIENYNKPCIIVDFANKYLGGFLLKGTFTQEDILFAIFPECLPSYLFSEKMKDNEAFLLQGVERFSNYQGYESTFRFNGKHNDETVVLNNIRDSAIVAIDAINFLYKNMNEFSSEALLREMNKSYLGFNANNFDNCSKIISTGKWGCGIFGGNTQLKFLIQWIACSRSNRKMAFHYRNDKTLENIEIIYGVLKNYKVKDLSKFLFNNVSNLKNKNIFFELMSNFI